MHTSQTSPTVCDCSRATCATLTAADDGLAVGDQALLVGPTTAVDSVYAGRQVANLFQFAGGVYGKLKPVDSAPGVGHRDQ